MKKFLGKGTFFINGVPCFKFTDLTVDTDMKGKLATQFGTDTEEGKYSDLKVMNSAAGYYIGTTFDHKEGWSEPGSRESEYFKTEAEAQIALDENSFTQRVNQ